MAQELITEKGLVESVGSGAARVRILEEEIDEQRCHACGMCESGRHERVIDAVPMEGVKPGMRVRVELERQPVLIGTLVLLLMPLCMFIAGAVFGSFVLPDMNPELAKYSNGLGVLFALVFIAATYLAIFIVNRSRPKKAPLVARIVEILPSSQDGACGLDVESSSFKAEAFDEALAAKVREEMGRISGVKEVRVDSASGRITVHHDPAILKRQHIREVLLVMGVALVE
jgi:positive regulator of sigma E activity/copper chaperone CopZ